MVKLENRKPPMYHKVENRSKKTFSAKLFGILNAKFLDMALTGTEKIIVVVEQ